MGFCLLAVGPNAVVGCFCYSACIIIADVSGIHTCSFVGLSPINLAFVGAAVASGHYEEPHPATQDELERSCCLCPFSPATDCLHRCSTAGDD